MKPKPYPQYKDSGIEWLGEVPEHWEYKRLKNILTNKVSDGPHETPDFIDEGIPFLSADSIQDGQLVFDNCRYISSEDHERFKIKSTICLNDILMCKAASTGKIARVKTSMEFSVWSPLAIIKANNRIALSAYLEYVLKSSLAQSQIDVLCTSNTQFNISMDDIPKIVMPLPKLIEQKEIATFLDRETSRIDALIQKKERMIELLKEKRIALITQSVTKGLDLNVPMKDSGIEWLGEVPAHWDIEKPTRLFRLVKGINAAKLTKEYISENQGEYPVYSGQTEDDGLMGSIDWYDFDFEIPVIFITTVGAKAMTTRIVRGKFSLSQNCALAIPINSMIDARFFEPTFQRLFDYEKGSISLIMQPSLRFEDFNHFKIPYPNTIEQQTIAAFIDRETTRIDALSSKVNDSITLLREYRSSLINAAVTGKIDLRDAL